VNDRVRYALRLADDALIGAQRLAETIADSPQIEQDVASANVALDLLGQARAGYAYAAEHHPDHPSEDDFAYLRTEGEFSNVLLVELPNADFAHTVVRMLCLAAYQRELYAGLAGSADPALAGIAGKAAKEVAYHFAHFAGWATRLGDGTAESHGRMVAALEAVWPYTYELFEPDGCTSRLAAAGIAVDPAGLRAGFDAGLAPVFAAATLDVPEGTWRPGGGRAGRHTEGFGYLLAEMQSVARAYPGTRW
jgi:ring-1,2-phenylacetyl-CoA epoxidase subunit PaaC